MTHGRELEFPVPPHARREKLAESDGGLGSHRAASNRLSLRQTGGIETNKVVCVGFLPPPIDGQRIVTERMFEQVASITSMRRFDLGQFRRFGHLSKLLSVLAVCIGLGIARFSGFSRLYLAPHSGSGLAYSCLIVLVSRVLRYENFVHYHSYKNLTSYSRLMRVFLAVCGKDATHIVLAPPMARDLQQLYRSEKRVAVLSNSVFIPQHLRLRRSAGRKLRVGHLSNLSRSKGVLEVIDCMRHLVERNATVELVLAGPAEDNDTRALLAIAMREFGDRFSYLGPLSRDEAMRFYEDIDVFLFPTSYEHEAEPLVLIESLSFAVPVIATDRGCIKYLLGPNCGLVLDPADFINEAVEQIMRWTNDRGEWDRASERAHTRFLELRRQAQSELLRLLSKISGENKADAVECHIST